MKRGNVWLGVSGLVTDDLGRFLVVKKRYSGLKGQWSFPAGFVNEGETLDQAAIREVQEETGIRAEIEGCIGIRTGVIKETISDNLIIFKLKASDTTITIQEKEISTAAFVDPKILVESVDSSLLVKHFANQLGTALLKGDYQSNPGDHFGYSSYHLFL
ncbi:NUDIX hydrolase [Bacillus carboniphilus]|uniref:NUDIX hydrolase n=1 Tax=Bacillus carboniphilus TaxID=86663 RepID=A0ABP3FXN0_9BACI